MKIQPLILLAGSILWSVIALAQSPQQVNYQAVARDVETGMELINQPLVVYFTILDGGPQGTSLYQEEHTTETNVFGLVNVQIGAGTLLDGSFAEIDWGSGDKWLQVDMEWGDVAELISNTKLISVPYALHAQTAQTAETVLNVDDADSDPTNEWVDSLQLNTNDLVLYQAENIVSVSLMDLINDADADPTNELVDSLHLFGTELQLFEGGVTHFVDLMSLLEDADADPTNELVDSLHFSGTSLQLFQEGSMLEISLEDLVNDADSDPTNELVDSLHLFGTELQLFEGGVTHFVDLMSLLEDADADPTNELVDSLHLSGTSLQLFQEGSMLEISLEDLVNDADSDPTNELIDEGSLQLNDTILVFTEGGINHEVSLASLINFGPWQVGDDIVFNVPDNIGIGTDHPEHKLHVLNNGELSGDTVAVFVNSGSALNRQYGVFSRVDGGTETRAIYGDAPGAGNSRWAGYFDRGNVYVSNRLALGGANTSAQFSIAGESNSTPILSARTQNNIHALNVQGDGKVGVGTNDPHSNFHSAGSVAGSVRFIDSSVGNIVLGDNDYMVIVDVTGGATQITLPPAANCEGRIYYIKRTYTTATNNTLGIAPAAGETIDGTPFPILLSSTSAKESKVLVSAGENGWFVMAE